MMGALLFIAVSLLAFAVVEKRLATTVITGPMVFVAMQGEVSMTTVEVMMPRLFAQLAEHGQIDRALAVARRHVRGRHDAWMPALFCRLKNGRLWLVGARSKQIIDFTAERGRHEHFFGREDILADIDEQVRTQTRGWVVVTGGPGLWARARCSRNGCRGASKRGCGPRFTSSGAGT